MRSIRRSLLGYLLLLLALALGAVGTLVERFANAAFRQREGAETQRIEQAFDVRKREVKTQFNVDLEASTKVLAVDVHGRTRAILGQAFDFRARPGGKMPPPEAPLVLRASEEEARQYLLRSCLISLSPAPGLLPSLAPEIATFPGLRSARVPQAPPPKPPPPGPPSRGPDMRPFFPYPYPNWVEFDGPRALTRIQEGLRREFADDFRSDHCQITLVASYHGARRTVSIRPGRLQVELPAPHTDSPADQEPVSEDVEIPGWGASRHVVTGARPGRGPSWFRVWLPPPPPPAAQPGYTRFLLTRPPDFSLRLYVHLARPYSELDARLAADQKERDSQLDRVRGETRMQLAQLRARLILIGTGTFAALVLGGWLIVARGLSPLRLLSDAVSRVSEKDFRLPVVPAELGRELAPIHARLTQTLTLLQRAFAREKQAVADISHELRTPIASLLATIDVALRKPRTPDQYRTTLEECRLISKQLGQLVERIMTLASLDAGNDHTATARVDGGDLSAGCAAVIRPLAAANNVGLLTTHDEELWLDTDAGKLREVLMNLLHNAVEYNKPGGTIELTAQREGDSVVFEVRDTGIGMTSDVKDRIFERFFRADASRSATGVHAGLGLAIVKEYVARLGGAITVESEPGVGTTFRVTLPLAATTLPVSGDRIRARIVQSGA